MTKKLYTQYRDYEIARNRGRFWLNKNGFRVEWGPYKTIGAAKTAIDRHIDGPGEYERYWGEPYKTKRYSNPAGKSLTLRNMSGRRSRDVGTHTLL